MNNSKPCPICDEVHTSSHHIDTVRTTLQFKLQITTSNTSEPFWVYVRAFSESEAQSEYWAKHPTHSIIATKCID